MKFNPKNTSRRCSRCGHTHKDNRKSQAVFVCVKCGFKCNADKNSAYNISAAGQAAHDCSDDGITCVSKKKRMVKKSKKLAITILYLKTQVKESSPFMAGRMSNRKTQNE